MQSTEFYNWLNFVTNRPSFITEFYNQPNNIAIMLLFNIKDREAKELLPYSIFIITRHCKRVKIHVMVEELLPNKKYSVLI